MCALYGDADSMRFVGDGLPLDRAACERWIQVTFNNYRTRGYGLSVIESADAGAVMGFCGIVHPGGQEQPEIKYAISPAYRGRGFGTKAVIGMLDHAATRFAMTHIIATVAPENIGSVHILLKAGMSHRETRVDKSGLAVAVYDWYAVRP